MKQDKKHRKAINKLFTKKTHASQSLRMFNEYIDILNEEINLKKIKNAKKYESSNKSKIYNEPKINCNLNNVLFRVSENKTNLNKSINIIQFIDLAYPYIQQ
jgi:hypothetical protein